MIIGIDAGIKTGIAIFENGKLVELKTLTPYNAILFFQNTTITKAVIEYSKGQSHIFSQRHGMPKAVIGKVGRNVGQVDAMCDMFIECLESKLVDVVKYTPSQKGRKWGAEDFKCSFPNWKPVTNSHTRDAVKIVVKFNHHL